MSADPAALITPIYLLTGSDLVQAFRTLTGSRLQGPPASPFPFPGTLHTSSEAPYIQPVPSDSTSPSPCPCDRQLFVKSTNALVIN